MIWKGKRLVQTRQIKNSLLLKIERFPMFFPFKKLEHSPGLVKDSVNEWEKESKTDEGNNPQSGEESSEEDESDDCDFTWSALEEQAENEDIGDDEDLPDATRNTIRSLQNYYNCMHGSLYFSSVHNLTQYTFPILVWYILSFPESLATMWHVQEPPPPFIPKPNEVNIKKMYSPNCLYVRWYSNVGNVM